MQTERKSKCINAVFGDFEGGELVWKTQARGKLLLETRNGSCTLTFIQTGNPLVKAGHLVKESADMILDVTKLGGRVVWVAGKAVMGKTSYGTSRGAQKDLDNLSYHYRKHRDENFNLEKIEVPRFSCRINSSTCADLFPGKQPVNLLGVSMLVLQSYTLQQAHSGYFYPVCGFVLDTSREAEQVLDLIRREMPSVRVEKHDPI